jgi:hypothetical protein
MAGSVQNRPRRFTAILVLPMITGVFIPHDDTTFHAVGPRFVTNFQIIAGGGFILWYK